MIDETRGEEAARMSARKTDQKERGDASESGDRKGRVTLYFRRSLLEEARSAVIQAGYAGEAPQSLSELVDHALEAELRRLRKRLNGGEAFRPFKAPLPGGRPKGRS